MSHHDTQSAYHSRARHYYFSKWQRQHPKFFTCYWLCIVNGLYTRTLWKHNLFYRWSSILKLCYNCWSWRGFKSFRQQLDAELFVEQHSGRWSVDSNFVSSALTLLRCCARHINICVEHFRWMRKLTNSYAGDAACRYPKSIQCTITIDCFVLPYALRLYRVK
jgi:hypothetical protein